MKTSDFNPNDNKWDTLIAAVGYDIKHQLDFGSVSCTNLIKEDRDKLLGFFQTFGNKQYKYYLHEENDRINLCYKKLSQ